MRAVTQNTLQTHAKDSYYFTEMNISKIFQSAICAFRQEAHFYFCDGFIVFVRLK